MFLGILRHPPPFERPSMIYLLLTCPVKVLLHGLHYLFNALRVSLPKKEPAVRVVCISDTHALIPAAIPPGDILIHAGDLTNDGTIPDIQTQIDWISKLPHSHKICIAGNHDTYLDPRTRPSLSASDRTGALDWKSIHYLQHSTINLTISSSSHSRNLQIYGAPQIPACGPSDIFAFQYTSGSDAWTETIPSTTNILVTHTPPKHHLDISLPSGLGCQYLLEEVRRVKPTLHVFGHVHWGAGQDICHWDKAQGSYERGMSRSNGWTAGWLDLGLWADIIQVIIYGTGAVVWARVWGGQDTTKNTVMVNAAQMRGNTGELGSRVQVVDI